MTYCADCGKVNEFGGTVHHYCKGPGVTIQEIESGLAKLEHAIDYLSTHANWSADGTGDDATDEALRIMDSAHDKLCNQIDETI